MSNLVESILSEDYVSASSIFEARLNEIAEKKLIEMKKMLQTEITGGLTKADIAKRRKAGYVRASEVLPDPRDIEIKSFDYKPPSGKKITTKRKKKISEALSDTDIERIGAERQAAQQAQHKDLRSTFGVEKDPKKTGLKAVPWAHRGKGGEGVGKKMDYSWQSDDLDRVRKLRDRGSKQAAKLMKVTATKRNIGGFKDVMVNVAKGIGKGFADNSPI